MGEREPRDVLGEALRNLHFAAIDVEPLCPWSDATPSARENWREIADTRILARLSQAGYRIVKEKEDDARRH